VVVADYDTDHDAAARSMVPRAAPAGGKADAGTPAGTRVGAGRLTAFDCSSVGNAVSFKKLGICAEISLLSIPYLSSGG
jgi:hypothetical protein